MRPKILIALSVIGLVSMVAWQIGGAVIANIELRDDMEDIASQLSLHVGLAAPISDDDFRAAVIKKAKTYDIKLEPDQVTIQRTGNGPGDRIYLQARYSVPIRVPAYVFSMHFAPESGKRLFE